MSHSYVRRNWGEVYLACHRHFGNGVSMHLNSLLSSLPLDIVPASPERAVRAAHIRLEHGIGYADCFGIELATDSSEHTLVTADFAAGRAASQIAMEFLPPKSKPR